MIKITEDLLSRFWAKVDKQDIDSCWLWTASTVSPTKGRHVKKQLYGKIQTSRSEGKRKCLTAHKLSYLIHRGSIPNGYEVDHICNNTLCVNPTHLRITTRIQNSENRGGPALVKHIGTGVRGVYWSDRLKKYLASYTHYRKTYYIGSFSNLNEAALAIKLARNKVFTHNERDKD